MIKAALIASLALAFASQPPAMPPLPESRQEAYEFYALEWLDDGYPGVRNPDGELVPHPAYGAYVIRDYLTQYRQTGEARFLEAAELVAARAVARMDLFKGALVFWYRPRKDLLVSDHVIYSGLIQARYLQAFSELYEVTGDRRHLATAEQVLASLALSTEEGGVLRPRPGGGAVIEEWPDPAMGNFVLNGWTTAMLIVHEYAERHGSEAARALFERNLIALKAMLALFDMPEIANSRYQLAGISAMRLRMSPVGGSWVSGEVVVPGEGIVPIAESGDDRWTNFVISPPGYRAPIANIVLNYVSYPEPNVVRVTVLAEHAGEIGLDLLIGDYDPLASMIVDRDWAEIGRAEVTPGVNEIAFEIPWEAARFTAYPTNFRKEIGGRHFNVYHFLHIENLSRLAAITGEPSFDAYADRWQTYADERWPEMPLYADAGVELRAYFDLEGVQQ
ncbi:MAG: D-glucuronyl C5-epimerase family protein [Oceanicaulis sp.]